MLYFGNKGHLCLTIRPIKETNAFSQRSDNKPFKKHLRHNITKKHENYIEFLNAFPSMVQRWGAHEY